MAGRYDGRQGVPQTPRESKIPGNKRVTAPSGKTTWLIKSKDTTQGATR